MKQLSLIVSLLVSIIAFGQSFKKEKALNSWDSLYMKHEQVLNMCKERVSKEIFKTDSLVTKDSIVVTLFSKSSIVLQKIINSLDSSGCVKFVRDEYYNSRGSIAYVRSYRQSCPIKIVTREEDREFHPVYYERFEYDENGKLVVWVYNISTSVTYKETYVSENGQWTKKRQ